MHWIILYDESGNKQDVQVRLTSNDRAIEIENTYPVVDTSNGVTWNLHYEAEENGHCNIHMNNRKYMFLFYDTKEVIGTHLTGDKILLSSENYLDDFQKLIERMGLNVIEENDMVTTWTIKMESMPYTVVTVFDESYNESVPLHVDGFEQYHRVSIGIEGVTTSTAMQLVQQGVIKRIEDIPMRRRPEGKYVVEWGGIFINEY